MNWKSWVARTVVPVLCFACVDSGKGAGEHDGRYYTKEEVDAGLTAKADTVHVHDDLYYTEAEVDAGLATGLAGKADQIHAHDDLYYTLAEVDAGLAAKADAVHAHGDLYYTEAEVDAGLSGKANLAHTHDDRYFTEAETTSAIAAHVPIVYVASSGPAGIALTSEVDAVQVLIKYTPFSGQVLARVDAELDTTGALYFIYNCKLQSKAYPAVFGTPFSDLPGARRTVSWRLGREMTGPGTPVSISMAAPVTTGGFGAEVRMVCWGVQDTANGTPPIFDYGVGLTSATLTLQPVTVN